MANKPIKPYIHPDQAERLTPSAGRLIDRLFSGGTFGRAKPGHVYTLEDKPNPNNQNTTPQEAPDYDAESR